jgi:hypothetical protein
MKELAELNFSVSKLKRLLALADYNARANTYKPREEEIWGMCGNYLYSLLHEAVTLRNWQTEYLSAKKLDKTNKSS